MDYLMDHYCYLALTDYYFHFTNYCCHFDFEIHCFHYYSVSLDLVNYYLCPAARYYCLYQVVSHLR